MCPIFTRRETKFPKPLFHFQSQAHLLKTNCVPGALQVDCRCRLKEPLGHRGRRVPVHALDMAPRREQLPWAGGSHEGELQLGRLQRMPEPGIEG